MVDDLEGWYRAERGRLVAALAVSAGSVDVAQDIASEAHARALERKRRVTSDPMSRGTRAQPALEA